MKISLAIITMIQCTPERVNGININYTGDMNLFVDAKWADACFSTQLFTVFMYNKDYVKLHHAHKIKYSGAVRRGTLKRQLGIKPAMYVLAL